MPDCVSFAVFISTVVTTTSFLALIAKGNTKIMAHNITASVVNIRLRIGVVLLIVQN